MMRLLLITVHLFATTGTYTTTPEAHGAAGDGIKDDTGAIRDALASCAIHRNTSLTLADEPCRVVFGKTYLSGPIRLNVSHITLDITGTLKMLPYKQYLNYHDQNPFISNDPNLVGLAIVGEGGTIESTSPLRWWMCKYTGCWRPHLIVLSSAFDVFVGAGLRLHDSPNHHMRIENCTVVRVDHLIVDSPLLSPNTDGVNFYGGKDQSFTNSVVTNGDDCVSVVPLNEFAEMCSMEPSSRDECRGGSLVVQNITCRGGHGISIGGVRHGTVSNVTFRNITATGGVGNTQGKYSTGGARLKSYPNSTGSVYDIIFEDIVFDGVYTPLQLLGHYCPWPCNTPDGNNPGTLFHDITFRNIRGGGRRQLQGQFTCSPKATCVNITVENVNLFQGGDPKKGGSFECEHAVLNVRNSTPEAC